MRPSAWQIAIIVLALILLFGWKSLPNMARSLGQSMRIFKSEVEQMKGPQDKDTPSPASTDTVRGETDTTGGNTGHTAAPDPAPREPGTGSAGPREDTAEQGGGGVEPRPDEPRA